VQRITKEPGEGKQVRANDGGYGRDHVCVNVQLRETEGHDGDSGPLDGIDPAEGAAHGGIVGHARPAPGLAQEVERGQKQNRHAQEDAENSGECDLLFCGKRQE